LVFRAIDKTGEFLMIYDFKGYKVDQDPTIKAIRCQKMRDYMAKLKHFADNPVTPVFISERSA
jgi:hypothetical protein